MLEFRALRGFGRLDLLAFFVALALLLLDLAAAIGFQRRSAIGKKFLDARKAAAVAFRPGRRARARLPVQAGRVGV